MNKLTAIILIGFSLLLTTNSACIKDANACFTVSTALAEVGDEIKFTNCSLKGDSYEWNFGDDVTSEERDPTHVYDAAGVYYVTLSAYTEKKKRRVVTNKTIIIERKIQKFFGDYSSTVGCPTSNGNPMERFNFSILERDDNSVYLLYTGGFLDSVIGTMDATGRALVINQKNVKASSSASRFDIKGDLKFSYTGTNTLIKYNFIANDTNYQNLAGVRICNQEGIK